MNENVKVRRKTSELKLIKQIIRLCEKSNISKIKYESIEIEFREIKKEVATKFENATSKYLDSPQVDMPPDDVMLFAATPSFDQMIDERRKSKKK